MGGPSLIGELGLNTLPFRKAVDGAKAYSDKFANDASGAIKARFTGLFSGLAGGALVGAASASISNFVEKTTEIKRLGREFNLTTDEVQKLQKAASKEGLDFSAFGTALEKINNQRKEAAEGNKGLRETFSRLGVSLDDLQNPLLRDYDIFMKVAHAVENEATPAVRAYFKELAGRGAGSLIAALPRIDTAKVRFSKEAIDSVQEARKAWKELSDVLTEVTGKLIQIAMYKPPKNAGQYIPVPQGAGKRDPVFLGPPLPTQKDIDEMDARSGEKLFKDQLAEAEKEKVIKAQKDLEDSIFKLSTDQLGVYAKQVVLLERINSLTREAEMLRSQGKESDALIKNKEAVDHQAQLNGLRQQLEDKNASRLSPLARARKLEGDIKHFENLSRFSADPDKSAVYKGQAQDRRIELYDVYKELAAQMKPDRDSMRDYGNFLGSDPNNDLLNEQKTANELLREIERNTVPRPAGGDFPPIP